MILKTRVFELYNGKYRNLSELAQAMGLSVSQVYRVRGDKRNINQKFIIGAIKAFPGHKFDDLFYFPPEPAAKEKQRMESTQQALEKFTSATEVYAQHLKSHTSALVNLKEASQELKKGAEELNKVLSYLIDVQSFSAN